MSEGLEMRFGILGPLEVWDDERPVAIGGPQQRAILAVLLLRANRVVSVDRLIDHVWGEHPPATARALLQGCVAGLRRSLRTGRGRTLLTRAPGYLLEILPGALDLDRFDELAQEADRQSTVDNFERAAALLTEALSLWRGPALDGIDLDVCRTEAARLEERRLAVLEKRIDVDLRLGRYPSLVAELQMLVRAHPLRERLWAQLMLALHGAGRQADALSTYQQVRRTLVEQLGVEPGGNLQQIQLAILSGQAPNAHREQAAVPARTVPAQLPAAVSGFSGRDQQLKRLDELLATGDGGARIGVVSGTAGVGKTALAVHWAHLVRDRFTDGQLYVNLRGYAKSSPTPAVEALGGFLRALGVPAEQIPADLDEASGLYRALLANRHLLIVLDNASNAEQVRPLLPGGAGCLVLVTSRDAFGGLVARDGANHLTLDVLTADEATALLFRILGDRAEADPKAAAKLAEQCARLPLALRIATANLTLQPWRAIADYVAELDTDDRLAVLAVEGDEHNAVRAAFDLSYRQLAADARRLFRLLGLVPGPDFTADAAAALAGTAPPRAARLLARLVQAHLLDQPTDGRYTFHDLLRHYAAERACDEESPARRQAAISRLYEWYLHRADAAAEMLYPHALRLPRASSGTVTAPAYEDHGSALAWLEAERPNLVAAVRAVVESGPRLAGCLLADVLRGYFQLRRYNADWLAVAEAALAAADADGDLRAMAAAQLSLGTARRAAGDHPAALRHYAKALGFARRCGWRECEATTLGNFGIVWQKLGRLKAAARQLDRALAIDREIGRRAGEANNLANLGNVYLQMGELDDAAGLLARAWQAHRRTDNRHGQALTLTWLGEVDHQLGRLDAATEHLTEALRLYLEIGDRDGRAVIHHCLATVDCDRGRYHSALQHAQTSLALAHDTGDRLTEATALSALAATHRCLGQFPQAVECYRRALGLARATATRRLEIEALVGLAGTHRCLGASGDEGHLTKALTLAQQALDLAGRDGYRVLEGRSRTELAAIHTA